MKWMKITLGMVAIILVLGAGAFLFFVPKNVAIGPDGAADASAAPVLAATSSLPASGTLPTVPEAAQPTSTTGITPESLRGVSDIAPQQPLANPPAVVKGIYLTGWTAGSSGRMAQIISMIKSTELNAVVVDIKDYSGYVSYAMDVPDVKASGA